MSILKDVTVDNQISRHTHDHETFISWNNDCQNIAFQAWLWDEGFPAFEVWYSLHREDYE